MGFGSIGLASVLGQAGALGSGAPAIGSHFAPTAKRVVHFFMNGGPSQVDTFDPKPVLTKYDGKPLPAENLRTERKTGAAFGSPFKFSRYGQSGLEISELFAKTAAHADDIAVIRSMVAQAPNHEPSLMLMNCGDSLQARPSVGSWVLYGLGAENNNLPGFISMCPGGYPIKDTENWQSAFLPGAYQGTYIDSKHTRMEKLIENIRSPHATAEIQQRQLELLRRLDGEYQRRAGKLLSASERNDMNKTFTSIKQGLREAIAHQKGGAKGVKTYTPSDVDVQALRQRIGLTQEQFAAKFGISLGTLRHWERGDRKPHGPALVLLRVIDKNDRAVLRALA